MTSARIWTRRPEAKSVVEELPGLGQGVRVGGPVLAGIVREGGEAEARRVVGSWPVLQTAIKNAFCLSFHPTLEDVDGQ